MGELHGSQARGLSPDMRISGVLLPPGSKSLAIRTLLAAGLGRGSTRIERVPAGEDVRACLGALASCGVELRDEGPGCVEVLGRSPAHGQLQNGPVQALHIRGGAHQLVKFGQNHRNAFCELRIATDRTRSATPVERCPEPVEG